MSLFGAPLEGGARGLLKEACADADSGRRASLLQTRAAGVTATVDGSGARRLDMGSLFGLGPLLPDGAESASLLGEVPEAGIAFVEYDGPDGFPARLTHLLLDLRPVRTHFAFDAGDDRWSAFSTSAPAWVTSRSEEHTEELQSQMRRSYPVFC